LFCIREATSEDDAVIAALWTEAYCGPGSGMRQEPYGVAEAEAARAEGKVLVAEHDEAAVGAVVLYPPGAPGRDLPGPQEAELSRLAVTRPSRRLGLGWRLVSDCIDTALEANIPSIVLWSRPHQRAAHSLYEALDFVRAPQRDSADELGPRQVFHISLIVDR
jgi:ribosomal protein S18 acetylase RimI-like enzyme